MALKGRIGWIGKSCRNFDISHNHDTARSQRPYHALYGMRGLVEMREQEPGIHQIIARLIGKVVDIASLKLHLELLLLSTLTCQLEFRGIHIDTGDLAFMAN